MGNKGFIFAMVIVAGVVISEVTKFIVLGNVAKKQIEAGNSVNFRL